MFRKPPPVEPVDLKLGPGRVVPLGDVVRTAFSKSDLVILGDTDHENGPLADTLESPGVLIGAAEGGATHVIPEAGQDAALRIGLIKLSEQLDMKLHKIDPQPGEEGRKMRWNWTGTDEQRRDAILDRLEMDSTHLARNIRNAVPEGEKALMIYGAAHFSGKQDPLVLSSMGMLKIDVYETRAGYESVMDAGKRMNQLSKDQGDNRRLYNNAPEAVYFTDKSTIHPTVDTPDWFRAKLETMGTPAPEAKPQPTPESAPTTPAPSTPPPSGGPAP